MKKNLLIATLLISSLAIVSGCGSSENTTGNVNEEKPSSTTEEAGVDNVYIASLPTGREKASIFVEPVAGISDDFIKGVDISTVLVEEASGVVYKNENGQPEDIFKILADSGVNYVRVRVWNDPYDKEGHGYGGGNCDYKTAAEIGKRAAAYNMKLLVDFHYSDFWADPSKQMVPKAWKNMTAAEKADAAYDFTLEAMNYILDAGADVGMVQLGNETNTGMSGETKWSDIGPIINKGGQAVKEAGANHNKDDIKLCVHFTNVENADGISTLIRKMKSSDVKYDVFAISYYPYWHGTFDNLVDVMNMIVEKTGKKVMIVENSYAFTEGDGDGNGNSVSEKDLIPEYAATVQSQANEVRDVCAAVASLGENGLGVFYWEPAWVPVKNTNGQWSDENSKIWETYGSGWASKYASEYDPDDAGKYYGGSAWDNQAMFDFDGKALPSLSVWKYLKYGTECDLLIDFVNDITVEMRPMEEINIPSEIEVQFNDRSKNAPAKVNWNQADLDAVDASKAGKYLINGKFEDGTDVKCTLIIRNENIVVNPSFEDSDRSMWTFTELNSNTVGFEQKATDAKTGEWQLHYWNAKEVKFTASYKFENIPDGEYSFNLYAQGGGGSASDKMSIMVETKEKTYEQDFSVDGWINWKNPTINNIEVTGGEATLIISVDAAAGAWGTFDDVYFSKVD